MGCPLAEQESCDLQTTDSAKEGQCGFNDPCVECMEPVLGTESCIYQFGAVGSIESQLISGLNAYWQNRNYDHNRNNNINEFLH